MDYSLMDFIRMSCYYLITKLFFPGARLVRQPIYIRGRKGIRYGKGFTTGHGCRLDASSDKLTLVIGENARIGDYVHINACQEVAIGNQVLMASKVFISDTSHGAYKGKEQASPYTNPSERALITAPVHIGDNVWIGENVVILPGTRIGNGCIIGANAVLSGREFPENCIIAGIPARIIKKFDDDSQQWIKWSE